MESPSAPIVTALLRSMQYMDGRNGGLLVDFRPIKSYLEIAPGENHYERVRTVLDWVAFGAEVGLLSARDWGAVFVQAAELRRFAAELRRYDLPLQEHHARAFEQLGVVPPGAIASYAALAGAIDAAHARRVAA